MSSKQVQRAGRAESPKPTKAEPAKDDSGKKEEKKEDKKEEQKGVSFRVWALILFVDALMLIASNLVFAYSSFKLDLKTRLGWDEPTLSIVWSFANAGMNFMVHLGWLYDRYGVKVAGPLSVLFKFVGLCGMAVLAHQRADRPLLFGACFFLDAQATAWAITLGQSEALKMSPASRAGTAVSVVKTAFSIGPMLWTYVYRWLLSPRIEELLLCSGIVAAVLIAAFTFAISYVGANDTKKTTKDNEDAPALSKLLLSFDCFVMCVTVSVVTWGTAIVWISNIANFAVASGYKDQVATIQSSFFTANMAARLTIGPLMDMFSVSKRMWVLLASTTMAISSLLMFVSGGALLPIAAVLTGASFGADASIEPIMCRLISPKRQATLYATSKMGGLLSSTAVIWFAGIQAERHAAGAENCVGVECYNSMWMLILAISVPSVCVTAVWAIKPALEKAKNN